MNIEPDVLLRFIRSLDPPLDVRLIDINGCTTVIRADVAEISEISTQHPRSLPMGPNRGGSYAVLRFRRNYPRI